MISASFAPTAVWRRPSCLRCLAIFALLVVWIQPAAASQTLRIGVYDNPPKIFATDDGHISGIFGDLLQAIASRQGWTLQPVACHWHQCLQWLQQGKIDIMPDVALSDAREQRFDFHKVPALLSWSQIYEARGQHLASLLDLNGKRVAVLAGSIQEEYLHQLADSFQLKVKWLQVPTIDAGFNALVRGRADAIATNYFIGNQESRNLKLTATPILFQPTKLFFAVPKGHDQDILNTIDHYLAQWQADNHSPYFAILDKWGADHVERRIPTLIWWVLGTLAAALLLVMGFSLLLRRQVADKTRSLRDSENRLNIILDSVEAFIYIKDRDLRYQYANHKVCELLGRPLEQIIGHSDEDFFDPATCESLRANDLRVIENGERVAKEESNTLAVDRSRHAYLSVKLPLRDANGNVYALCGISTDITEYRHIQDQLQQLAFFDPLTGLANRHLVMERLHHALTNRARSGLDGTLLMIDLNSFKTINDTMGHTVGDQLLQQVAQRLQQCLRGKDNIGRLSADEFVVILDELSDDPGQSVQHARALAQQIQDLLAEPYDLEGIQHTISTSIGVAMLSDAQDSPGTLLRAADLALTKAKAGGRNSLCFFNPAMQTEVNHRTRLEAALRRAIDQGDLQLYIQPQLDQQRRIIGMEALLRWHDPELGPVSPGEFIPMAEESGLIIPLGEWVLEQACHLLDQWRTQPGLDNLTLAVNISPRQFRHPNFVEHALQCVRDTGICAEHLELEITESLLIDDLEDTIARMQQLRSRGIRFSLDDFGTGYASLGYLKRLPLYQLKIDQSFVRDLLTDPNDEAIIRTIIALGRSLDLRVIAEGVETEAQAQRLMELGCHVFQGYWFGRPEPVSAWQEKLRDAG